MERWEKERKEYRNSLTELLLDQEKISWYEVDQCVNIESVTIGPKVKNIDWCAFHECPKLNRVEISPENKHFYLDGGCLIQKDNNKLILCMGDPRVPDYVEEVHMGCFNLRGRAEKLFFHKNVKKILPTQSFLSIGEVEIEQGGKYYETESGCVYERGGSRIILGCEKSVIGSRADAVGRGAFSGGGFTRFEIPESVKKIENDAFYNCFNLEEVVLNEGLEEIGDFAFAHCTALKSIKFPKSLTVTGSGAFYGCGALESIESFGGLSEISWRCFTSCGFKKLTVGGQIKKINDDAFWYSHELEEFTASDGLEEIGRDALYCCENLKKVTLADSVVKIGENAFGVCENLTEVKLSDALKQIPVKCFYECKSLPEIYFPEGLQRIESWAFYNCSKLQRTNAWELKSIKKIYADSFTGCRKLKKEGLVKKPPKLPTSFYTQFSFEELKEEAGNGKSHAFMKLSLSDFPAKIEDCVEYEGKRYLCLKKKDLQFCAEFLPELVKDELCQIYDVYVCVLVKDENLVQKIRAASPIIK